MCCNLRSPSSPVFLGRSTLSLTYCSSRPECCPPRQGPLPPLPMVLSRIPLSLKRSTCLGGAAVAIVLSNDVQRNGLIGEAEDFAPCGLAIRAFARFKTILAVSGPLLVGHVVHTLWSEANERSRCLLGCSKFANHYGKIIRFPAAIVFSNNFPRTTQCTAMRPTRFDKPAKNLSTWPHVLPRYPKR